MQHVDQLSLSHIHSTGVRNLIGEHLRFVNGSIYHHVLITIPFFQEGREQLVCRAACSMFMYRTYHVRRFLLVSLSTTLESLCLYRQYCSLRAALYVHRCFILWLTSNLISAPIKSSIRYQRKAKCRQTPNGPLPPSPHISRFAQRLSQFFSGSLPLNLALAPTPQAMALIDLID